MYAISLSLFSLSPLVLYSPLPELTLGSQDDCHWGVPIIPSLAELGLESL
jgi:hypothetical protein